MQNYIFLIGAPKCGTSNLAAMLGALPEIALARGKEPCFFTDFAERRWSGPGARAFARIPRDLADYHALFAHKPAAAWRLDASTDYLWNPAAAGRIADFAARPDVGEIRILAVLRDPVARIISEYQHTRRDQLETLGLTASLRAEAQRIADGWHPLFYHRLRSRYSGQIARYDALFGDRLEVLDFHAAQGEALLRQVSRNLGVEPVADVPADRNRNESYVTQSRTVKAALYNPALKRVARALVPREWRKAAWARIDRMNRTTIEVSEPDRAAIRESLADEIAACAADPRIPTVNWSQAFATPA
ncbi:MAG: sulfotransferase [Paracoccus sp. (in: a-proteobacteria)]|uniref:sulfotransferase n=2 Tax=Paracoccus TaxID=265 RepID=UPI000C4EE027|nr:MULTISPECIES: sulfotransferase [unclassified Paracoccus (in: a-proteobacteria)]MAN56202.1 hypothetical protein [Paracoccus sp. (in: a-proteobacteria)]MBA49587.1 hypothetical protein [Paracoccus sp. (in: a-proteobacteria)]MDB2551895.1 sulfotransferase [Paracoccus sp. (in: a-proteobacteria)]HIC66274.1 hypothetical protein [Paracoccus sp. (in: a-proteobacteria)]|tara:strand:+ start:3793 stop:4701 length:909 start_codon:yes stop_codon:yes gene_type:complete